MFCFIKIKLNNLNSECNYTKAHFNHKKNMLFYVVGFRRSIGKQMSILKENFFNLPAFLNFLY